MLCMEAGMSQAGRGMLRHVCLSSTEVEKDMKANGVGQPPVFSAQCQV